MRVILVGTAADRARLRSELDETRLHVVGEFDTLEQARADEAVREFDKAWGRVRHKGLGRWLRG